MKKKNYKLIKTIRISIVVLALTFSSNIHAAQPSLFGGWLSWLFGGHTHTQGCGHNSSTDSVPLDGGLGILLAGAAIFGVKKLRENKNEKV
ncbi:PID-CTERM protein-sorting domain-containing protein [Mariniflexile gromovii]|uniref:MYXO-CTERM domain-containing protein n=1 Tax=Mariniflexile gromovii TaxID=362523 RepID=A0ABS4BNU5_9FLAO|nr:hypothetical protein [Mariniflexile gromovii]MBP0902267.1 hypothetical protein [Mariniflexile gromovii]